MRALDRIVVLALGLSVASAALAWRAASPNLQLLGAEREQAAQQAGLLVRMLTSADRFDASLEPSDDRSTGDMGAGDELRRAVSDFKQAVVRLRDDGGEFQSTAVGLREVLQRGAGINDLIARHQLGGPAEQAWLSLRAELDRFARANAAARNPDAVQTTAPVAATGDRLQ